jgi:hypothetical protein
MSTFGGGMAMTLQMIIATPRGRCLGVSPEARIPEVCCGSARAPFDLNAVDYLTGLATKARIKYWPGSLAEFVIERRAQASPLFSTFVPRTKRA